MTSFKGGRVHAVHVHVVHSSSHCSAPFSPLSTHRSVSPGLCRLMKVPGLDDVVDGGRGERSRARREKQPGVYYLLLRVCLDITACS